MKKVKPVVYRRYSGTEYYVVSIPKSLNVSISKETTFIATDVISCPACDHTISGGNSVFFVGAKA